MIESRKYAFHEVNSLPVEVVAVFFRSLSRAGYETWFSPHPFTDDQANWLVSYEGRDYFVAIVEEDQILAYGMLRGWDDGYSVPSLGIATNPDHRGRGLGRAMMHHLHDVARSRNASRVRLTVDSDNSVARSLYESFGYAFEPYTNDRLEGKLEL